MTKARSVSTGAASKGDLVAGTGTNTSATLGVGTDGLVLTAASGQTTGLQWASPLPSQTGQSGNYLTTNGTTASWGAVSAGAMTLIQTINVAGGSSWTFSSIPQTYKSLKIIGRNLTQSTSNTTTFQLNWIPNGWATGTSTGNIIEYSPTSATATGFSSSTVNGTTTFLTSGGTVTRGATVGTQVNFEILIPEYTDTDATGTLWRMFNYIAYGTSNASNAVYTGDAYYKRNGAITSFTINETGGNTFAFAAGSISLYGIAG